MEKQEQIFKDVNLRNKAETRLKSNPVSFESFSLKDIKSYIHEIQVHQVELELQNEELVRAQDRLRKSEKRYFDFYELAPVGFLSLDSEGIVNEVNKTFLEMLGINKSAVYRKNIITVVEWNDRDKIYFMLRDLMSSGLTKDEQIKFIKSDNSILHTIIDGKSFYNDEFDKNELKLVVVDISKQKNYELELKNLLEELSLANETINDKVYKLDELKNKLEKTKTDLTEIITRKDNFIASISDDLMRVFSIFLAIAERINTHPSLSQDDDLLDSSNSLYDSVKATLSVIQKYYQLPND